MYALATGLVGFSSSSLRVRVERRDGDNVFVRTADLLDAGTPLCLTAAQVQPLEEAPAPVRHVSGLVTFEDDGCLTCGDPKCYFA